MIQYFLLRFLEAQIRMLRSRIDTSRIVPTPAERAELLRLGAAAEHDSPGLLGWFRMRGILCAVRLKLVANTSYCQDIARLGRIVLDLPSYMANVNVHDLGDAVVGVFPSKLDDLISGKNSIRPPC